MLPQGCSRYVSTLFATASGPVCKVEQAHPTFSCRWEMGAANRMKVIYVGRKCPAMRGLKQQDPVKLHFDGQTSHCENQNGLTLRYSRFFTLREFCCLVENHIYHLQQLWFYANEARMNVIPDTAMLHSVILLLSSSQR